MEFTRTTRLPVPPITEGEITVEVPPEVPRAVPVNPLTRLLPLAMIVATLGMMAVYFGSGATTGRHPMYGFFPVMMLVSLLGTLVYGARGSNSAAELNESRRDYLRYLGTVDEAVTEIADAQRRSLQWSHPPPESLWTLVGNARMWERTPGDSDFLHVRVGVGTQRLSATMVVPELAPLDEVDPVTSMALRRLIQRRSVVADVPIAVALRSFSVITIEGDEVAARGLARAMVCQLATLHSPEFLKVVAVVGSSVQGQWDWLKWLPHVQHSQSVDGAGAQRMVYRSVAEARHSCSAHQGGGTYIVLVVDGAVAEADMPGVTVLSIGAVETVGEEVLQLRAGPASVAAGDEEFARPDAMTVGQASVCARRLAPYRPGETASDLTGTPTGWSTLMGIDDPAHVEPSVLWHHAGSQLRAPIGVSDQGAVVELDIKEAARGGVGPHGLCVGATGSGKSEFLRTLTLGMITRHPPDVLNLVLVDFKGGATFLGLEPAPHICAVITNLADESALVARMQDALAGEMNRRQELLRRAGNFANVADYEAARRQARGLAPLPTLLIVVDEFSELLSQHPDFADLFVAIGRLGRSLGIHLLLASQRLDEGRLRGLETHLSYRICLKTFSANESRAVLGVPDAYHLPNTPGMAFLKTVSGELLRFRSAFVSAPHVEPIHTPDPVTEPKPLVFTAAVVGDVRRQTKRSNLSGPRILDTVVGRLAGHGTPAHQVWLPVLTESPTLHELLPGTSRPPVPLTVPVGVVDRPFEQRRDPLVVALGTGNLAVVGGPRSGKSTALRTVVLALAVTHDPRDVQIYCLDFGGGALSSLQPLPVVGSVASRLDADLVRRTVAELEAIVRSREARFRRLGIDSIAEYRRRRAAGEPAVDDDRFGEVFLVIDGWATVRQEFESIEAPITALAARGLAFGVHVVVAASRWAEIRPALKDQLGIRIELRLGDPAESEMNRKRARDLVHAPAGRGITGEGHELAIALPRVDGRTATTGLAAAIAATAETLHARHHGRSAPPIELLPDRVHQRTLFRSGGISATRILIGIGERELQPVSIDFAEDAHLIILGEAECGKTAALRMLCTEIVRTTEADAAQLMIVDFRRTLLGVVESEHLAGYAMSTTTLAAQLDTLLERLQARMPGDDLTQRQLRSRSWWSGPEIYVVVDDYDLVAAATGNPLTALLEYVPHAKDLGLHVAVARRSGGAARAMFDPLLARLRDLGASGLMMSASPEEGVLFGTARPSRLPSGRGTLITRAHPDQLIQVAWTDPP
jgi:S-DNA-T family DNA segregation ATPase FtsK/SpoIIIE